MATTYTLANLRDATGCPKWEHQWRSDKGGATINFVKQRLNFANIAAAASSATQAANDVFRAIPVNTGDTVLTCGFNIAASSTATASCDFDVGIGTDVDGFIDGIEGDDATPTVVAAPFGLLSGTRFNSADTLDVKALTAAAGSGVMDLWAIILKIG